MDWKAISMLNNPEAPTFERDTEREEEMSAGDDDDRNEIHSTQNVSYDERGVSVANHSTTN